MYIYIYIVGNTVDNGIRMECSQSTNWWIMSSVCRDQAKSLLRSVAESTGIILRCEMTWLTNLWQGCHQLIHQSINRTDVGWGWDSPKRSWIVTIPIPFRNHQSPMIIYHTSQYSLLKIHANYTCWWFFATPLKNHGVRQLGWWHDPNWMESHKIPWFQTTNQYIYVYVQ